MIGQSVGPSQHLKASQHSGEAPHGGIVVAVSVGFLKWEISEMDGLKGKSY
jgi:hypothetical protein